MTWKWLTPLGVLCLKENDHYWELVKACMALWNIMYLMLFQRVVRKIQKDYIVDG